MEMCRQKHVGPFSRMPSFFFLKEKKELNQSKVRKGNGNMDLEIHMFCFDSWLSFTAHQLGVGAEIGSSTRVVSQNCSAL